MRVRRPSLAALLVAGSLLLAGGSGFLASQARGRGGQATRTVTINVATGPAGPAGPAGPQGPDGSSCPTGYTAGVLVINHLGGQTVIWTCLHD